MTELFPREGQFIHPALGLIPQPNAFEKKTKMTGSMKENLQNKN